MPADGSSFFFEGFFFLEGGRVFFWILVLVGIFEGVVGAFFVRIRECADIRWRKWVALLALTRVKSGPFIVRV